MPLPFASCPCQREDAEADAGNLAQSEETFKGGGTGGHDVIDEDDVLALQDIGIGKGEGTADILLALLVGEGSLADVEMGAEEDVGDDGCADDVADALAEDEALVIAALAMTVSGYRHGDESIGCGEELACHGVVCHDLAHEAA